MPQPPIFFDKNFMDLDFADPTITVTDAVATNTGQSFVNNTRDRKNHTGWATSGSTDAAGTKLVGDFGQVRTIDSIVLVGHNFKSFTLKHKDGSFIDFSTVIAPTTNTLATTFHEFDAVTFQEWELIVNSTFVVDDDKFLAQIIMTTKIGQFVGNPEIRRVVLDQNKKTVQSESGLFHIKESPTSYAAQLRFKQYSDDTDLSLMETVMFDKKLGFLFWPAANDEAQFKNKRVGYRLEDIFFVKSINEWSPNWAKGIYTTGLEKPTIRMVEVIR